MSYRNICCLLDASNVVSVLELQAVPSEYWSDWSNTGNAGFFDSHFKSLKVFENASGTGEDFLVSS